MKQLSRRNRRRTSLTVTALLAAGLLAMSSGAGAELSGTVTSVTGDASIGENPAEVTGHVGPGDGIMTGPGSSCSVLIDGRSLVQFCGQATVRLRHDEERNATILDVEDGYTRALVGPRAPDEPLEIHTPVAIAAILGTILSVTVDPVTRESTFALEEGKVRIRTPDPTLGRSIILRAGQQVTIGADWRVGEVKRLERPRGADFADCLDDRFYHTASVEIARAGRSQLVTDAITSADIPYTGLPAVAAPPPGSPVELGEHFDPNPDDPCGLSPVCRNLDLPAPERKTKVLEETKKRGRRTPPPCGNIPGEQCY